MSAVGRIRLYLDFVEGELLAGEFTADEYHAIHDKLETVRSRAAGNLTQKVLDDQLARERAMKAALAEDKAARAADAVHAEVTE